MGTLIKFKDKSGFESTLNAEEEVYFANGSLYVDGQQFVIYNNDVADDDDIVSFIIKL